MTTGPGQPTKLTPERAQTIITLIENGNYKNVAAAAAGIEESTLYNWLARGRREAEEQDPIDPKSYTKAQLLAMAQEAGLAAPRSAGKAELAQLLNDRPPSPYVEFFKSLKSAEARREAFALQRAVQTGTDDWRFWMTFLERTAPDRWGRRERQDMLEEEPGIAGDAQARLERAREIKLKLLPGGKDAQAS